MIEGVDLTAWREGDEAVVAAADGELRFARGGSDEQTTAIDPRGVRWRLDGDPDLVDARLEGGEIAYGDYPDALGRLWSALHCPRAGDVVLSATPGYEFVDWGGSYHHGAAAMARCTAATRSAC